MRTLEIAFTAWLAFLSGLSVDTSVVLNPPASDAEIAKLEQTIGFELPDDLRALYKMTNGQQDPYYAEPKTGQYAVSLMGYYDLLSITAAIDAYQFQQEIQADYGDSMDYEITTVDGHFVDAVRWKAGWLPIAGSGANHIAIDLDPPEGGTYGQLITIGADEFERRVLARSLTDFFTTASDTTATDECSLEYGVPDTSDSHVPEEHRIKSNGYILYITEEWNHPFYRDLCEEKQMMEEQVYVEQPEYLIRSNELRTQLSEWLLVRGLSEQRQSKISLLAGLELDDIIRVSNGENYFELPEWFVPGGAIPQELLDAGEFPAEEFPGGVIPMNFHLPAMGDSIYLDSMAFKLACQQGVEASAADVHSVNKEDYRLFHQFLVASGVWTEQENNKAEERMLNLPPVTAEHDALGGVSFCTSSAD